MPKKKTKKCKDCKPCSCDFHEDSVFIILALATLCILLAIFIISNPVNTVLATL